MRPPPHVVSKREPSACAWLGRVPVQQIFVPVHGNQRKWGVLMQVDVAVRNMQIEARRARKRNLKPNDRGRRSCQSTSKRLLRERRARPEQIGFDVLRGKAVQGLVQHRRTSAQTSTSPAAIIK
jgi:hypothetical protein